MSDDPYFAPLLIEEVKKFVDDLHNLTFEHHKILPEKEIIIGLLSFTLGTLYDVYSEKRADEMLDFSIDQIKNKLGGK